MDMLLIKGMIAKEAMKESLKGFFKKESGEVNVVAIIVLIAVAIAIALVFRDKLAEFVGQMFGAINGESKMQDAIKKPSVN